MFFSFPNRHVSRQGRTSNRRWMLCRQVYFAWCAAAAVAEFLTCRHRNDCSSKSLSETHKNEKSQSVYVFLCFLILVSGHVLHANWFICLKPVVLKRPGIKKPQGKCSLKLQQAKLIWISSFFWYIPVDLQVSKIPLRSFLWLLLDANSEGQGMLQKTLKSTNKWLQLVEVIADS